MDRKPIIINQRLPLHTLEVALISFLNNNYSREYIQEQLALEFSGDNRIKKASTLLAKIIPNNPLKSELLEHKEEVLNAIKKKDDRNVILIALVNAALPFAFDVLATFGKYFSVQDIISTEAIKKTISSIYGGNRSMENGLYAVVPMFVEANFFTREKPGIYKFEKPFRPQLPISRILYQESFRINKNTIKSAEMDQNDPYFYFLH
ncbi:hypothetical protein DET49_1306 [Salegentibacter sp. 24]|uniref:hypothetical protein n=1 Tax=Salegentibacter sp. 24 TaxID=2183986 RepID=UPI00105E0044|nr:hypothetical protein [Salegentibacter sp. 24]TDN80794.1 hypothetical protein DET49_1306 [Salegentibacter sp. 24]